MSRPQHRPSTPQGVQLGGDFPEAAVQRAPDCRGRHVEDERIQAGVGGAEEQSRVPPLQAVLKGVAHHVGGVVRPEADDEHQQRAERQADAAQPPPPADVWKTGQDADEVDVAEAADEEGDAEEHEEELQADRQQDVQLLCCEVQVAGGLRAAAVDVEVRVFAPPVVRHDVDEAEVQRAHQPEHDAGPNGIARPAACGVPQREGDTQVTVDAHRREQQRAVVDGDVEDEARERTQRVGQQPGHVVVGLLHLKRQENQKNEVGDGEVEQEDVYGRRLAAQFAAERAERQDVEREAHQEGEDVDGKQQVSVQHDGGSDPGSRSQRSCTTGSRDRTLRVQTSKFICRLIGGKI